MRQAPRFFTRKTALVWLIVPLALTACELPQSAPPPPEPGVLTATRNGPPGAPEGTCWGKTVSPAVVQTVEQQVQIKPAQINADGTVAAPPKYRTTTRQEIVTPRVENWFETLCAEDLTPEFVASLQRALSARGFYAGDANGVLDVPTRAAIQNLQRLDGPDSSILTLDTARKLGLVVAEKYAPQ